MHTRREKHKLSAIKPASQLFLFSNKLNKNIDAYFSGNVIIEIELSGYDYMYHDEAEQVVSFMIEYCETIAIERYKYMTVVLNYKALGLTMAMLSGDYNYSVAVHGTKGYKQLKEIHATFIALLERRMSFEDYKRFTLEYYHLASQEPINLSIRSVNSITNQLKKTEHSIMKSRSAVLAKFHKKFQPSYRK